MTSGSYVPLIRLLRPLIAALLGCVLLCGCDTSHSERAADKAGGSEAPRVLLLGASDTVDQPESRAVRYFAGQVAKLSHGALRVELRFEAAGDRSPDVEARTEQMVRDGKFDLGWIGARAWDARGVKSFQALQAPFLVTNYALLDRVLTSPLANEMLAGLKRQHVVGIALLPGLLRHPVGLRGPLVSLADFRRARVRIQPSPATSE